MESKKYQRKWEELNRAFERLKKFYENYIQDEQDSFNGPKDFVNNFFRISYELKENIKNSKKVSQELKGHDVKVEDFVRTNPLIALSIDITNKEKHLNLNDNKSGKKIGIINTYVHLFDPNGNNRTELTIEIDGEKKDCLELAEKVVKEWKTFLINNNLIK